MEQGQIQFEKGKFDLAQYHYEKALEYNSASIEAKEKLEGISNILLEDELAEEVMVKSPDEILDYLYIDGDGSDMGKEIKVTYIKDGVSKEKTFKGLYTTLEDLDGDGKPEIQNGVKINHEYLTSVESPYWVDIYHFDIEKEDFIKEVHNKYNDFYRNQYIARLDRGLTVDNRPTVVSVMQEITNDVLDGYLSADISNIEEKFNILYKKALTSQMEDYDYEVSIGLTGEDFIRQFNENTENQYNTTFISSDSTVPYDLYKVFLTDNVQIGGMVNENGSLRGVFLTGDLITQDDYKEFIQGLIQILTIVERDNGTKQEIITALEGVSEGKRNFIANGKVFTTSVSGSVRLFGVTPEGLQQEVEGDRS